VSPGKRPKAAPPSFRTEVTRRAVTLGVKAEDLERALIIGQIAGLLAKDPALKGKIAHKGAAMSIRATWLALAADLHVDIRLVECVCSDLALHRTRMRGRDRRMAGVVVG